MLYNFNNLRQQLKLFYGLGKIDAITYSNWSTYLDNLEKRTDYSPEKMRERLMVLYEAMQARLDEQNAHNLLVIIGGTIAGTAKDVVKGVAEIGKTAISVGKGGLGLVRFLTQPVILVIIIVLIIVILFRRGVL